MRLGRLEQRLCLVPDGLGGEPLRPIEERLQRACQLGTAGGANLALLGEDERWIALERGVPALLVWLALIGAYARTLWRTRRLVPNENWIERGIVLGSLGGLLGFMTSGVVHYNWGDSEVVMILYLLMGLSLVVERNHRTNSVASQ